MYNSYDNRIENTGMNYQINRRSKIAEKHKQAQSDDKEKSEILGELKDLETDVNGFSKAMKGMAEVMILGDKTGGIELEERLVEKHKAHKKSKVKKKKKQLTRLQKAELKTQSQKKKFENKMVDFFTGYICGEEC